MTLICGQFPLLSMASALHQPQSCAQWSVHSYLHSYSLTETTPSSLATLNSTLRSTEAFCISKRVDGIMRNIKGTVHPTLCYHHTVSTHEHDFFFKTDFDKIAIFKMR